MANQSADPALAEAAGQALRRITSVLPNDLRLEVETSGLFVPGRCDAPLTETWLPTLRQAIRREHILQLDYRDAEDSPSQRRIWPFAMAFFDETRLIAAWCELRQDFRHFRADRVQRLTDTGQRYPERAPACCAAGAFNKVLRWIEPATGIETTRITRRAP